jgi:hypothetical protein
VRRAEYTETTLRGHLGLGPARALDERQQRHAAAKG